MNMIKETNPAYYKYSCAESNKSTHGTLEASLIFCTKLSNSPEEIGYHRNKYDRCVMNKIIKVKQCNILWYVGDLKMQHVHSNIVSSVLSDIGA